MGSGEWEVGSRKWEVGGREENRLGLSGNMGESGLVDS